MLTLSLGDEKAHTYPAPPFYQEPPKSAAC